VSQKDASDAPSSDNLAVMLYSDSDASSDDLYSIVTLYSVVKPSDSLYSSSDRGLSLYSVVIKESCEL
jgi:hypothetical protein